MQLEELEIISSIFCGPRELVIDDPGIIVDMHSFIDQETNFLNRKLDYRIQMTVVGLKNRLEVFVELPHYYPALELPIVTLSYPNITTTQHHLLKGVVEDALRDLQKTDETYVFGFISWLSDDPTVQKVLNNVELEKPKRKKKEGEGKPEKPQRLWIVSHHIKSKRKRADILDHARDLQLTGFSLPGKPGVICVEGAQSETQEFLGRVKAMHWQRIQLKLEETGDELGEKAIKEFRKFSRFDEETKFIVHSSGPGVAAPESDDDENNSSTMNAAEAADNGGEPAEEVVRLNMSTFGTYLEQHNCGHVLAILFGFKA